MFSAEYFCGICKLPCDGSCICCDSCQTWMHYSCLNFDQSVILALETELLDEQYFCISCSTENGIFKYRESLARLKEANAFGKLKKISQMELIMMPQRDFRPMKDCDLISIVSQDENVNTMLEKYNTQNFKALCSTSNGNCLFNSASLVLSGSEEYATELRVRTCLMMALNREKILCNENLNLSEICDTYDASCLQCAEDKTWANAYTIAGLAMALNIRILSIYPPQNGIIDKSYIYLNRFFNPGDTYVAEIVLFWSGYYNKKGYWVADHFVPLVRIDDHNVHPRIFENPDHNTHLGFFDNPGQNVQPSMFANPVKVEPDFYFEEYNDAKHRDEDIHVGTVESPTMNEDNEHLHSDKITDTEQRTDMPGVTYCEKFLTSPREIYEYVNSSKNILYDYPVGIKSNCQFILKYNKECQPGRLKTFYDDCGEWDYVKKKLYHNDLYMRENFKIIHRRGNEFYYKKNISGDYQYVKIDPQPKDEDIINIVRYQVRHKLSEEFIRRISYITDPKCPRISELMLYQYKGTQPLNSNYVRTNPKILRNIKDNLEKPSRKLYIRNPDVRNYRVITNLKCRQKKRLRNNKN